MYLFMAQVGDKLSIQAPTRLLMAWHHPPRTVDPNPADSGRKDPSHSEEQDTWKYFLLGLTLFRLPSFVRVICGVLTEGFRRTRLRLRPGSPGLIPLAGQRCRTTALPSLTLTSPLVRWPGCGSLRTFSSTFHLSVHTVPLDGSNTRR